MMLDSVLTILAGGTSRRYQLKNSQWQDKALIRINQIPLLVHLLKRSSIYYQNLCISVNTSQRKENYLNIISSHISRVPDFVLDFQDTQLKGVFLGIYSALRKYPNKKVQFIPSDRPFLDFKILSEMKSEKSSVSVLQHETGMIEPLLSLYGKNIYFPEEFKQLPLTRADVLIRLSPNLQIYNATSILKENNLPSYIFDNINVQGDFTKTKEITYDVNELKIPEPVEIKRNESFSPGNSTNVKDFLKELMENDNFYLAFLWSQYFIMKSHNSVKELTSIGKLCLNKEYLYWLNNGMPFLALHSLQDLVYFFPEEENKRITKEIDKLKIQIKFKSKKM